MSPCQRGGGALQRSKLPKATHSGDCVPLCPLGNFAASTGPLASGASALFGSNCETCLSVISYGVARSDPASQSSRRIAVAVVVVVGRWSEFPAQPQVSIPPPGRARAAANGCRMAASHVNLPAAGPARANATSRLITRCVLTSDGVHRGERERGFSSGAPPTTPVLAGIVAVAWAMWYRRSGLVWLCWWLHDGDPNHQLAPTH